MWQNWVSPFNQDQFSGIPQWGAPAPAGPMTSPTGGPTMMGPQTTSLGFNGPTAQLALSGLQTIGSLWNAFQANKLAKKAFNFQKDFANTNLRNQTQTYNTAMADRVGNRAFVQGMSPDQASAYLRQNQLVLPPSAMGRGG